MLIVYYIYNIYYLFYIYWSYWYVFSPDILVLLSWTYKENPIDLLENFIHTIWEILNLVQ